MRRRVGLVGTGCWADAVHAPSLSASPDVDFVGLWGRNNKERERLATAREVVPFETFDALLDQVDIVDFAVPPNVQSGLALEAARAGKHLLLEKPIGLGLQESHRFAESLLGSEVQSLVFLTRLFDPVRSRWLAESVGRRWSSAHAEWRSGALVPGGNYDDSQWRHASGVLWDLGPHVLSQFIAVLGPVTSVSVNSFQPGGFTEVAFRHRAGATSTVRMTLHGDPADYTEWIEFADGRGRSRSPGTRIDSVSSHGRAIARLVSLIDKPSLALEPENAGSSVNASLEAVRVLCAAQELIDSSNYSGEFVPVGHRE